MNSTIDPCDDFYEYACGNWLIDNKMPANSYTYSVVTKIGEQNSRILFEALSRPEKRIKNDVTGWQKAKDFYKSCQNIRILNEKGMSHMSHIRS